MRRDPKIPKGQTCRQTTRRRGKLLINFPYLTSLIRRLDGGERSAFLLIVFVLDRAALDGNQEGLPVGFDTQVVLSAPEQAPEQRSGLCQASRNVKRIFSIGSLLTCSELNFYFLNPLVSPWNLPVFSCEWSEGGGDFVTAWSQRRMDALRQT